MQITQTVLPMTIGRLVLPLVPTSQAGKSCRPHTKFHHRSRDVLGREFQLATSLQLLGHTNAAA